MESSPEGPKTSASSTEKPSAPNNPEHDDSDPGIDVVYKYLMYSVSLPEPALRTTSALVGGVLKESVELLVPQAFQSSKTYSIFVDQMLDIVVNQVGNVEEAKDDTEQAAEGEEAQDVKDYVARKAVGNFVEMAGMATLHLSPLTVLAVLSDVAYGSQTYLNELSDELKAHGIIDEDSTIDHASDLLDAVKHASSVTADAFDQPPLSVDGLKETIEQTQVAVSNIDVGKLAPQAEISRLWDEMHSVATEEGVGVFELATNMSMYTVDKVGDVATGALSTVTVAGNMFDRHILDHYSNSLVAIHEKGYYQSLADSSRPYLAAVWTNFSTENTTVTEEILSGRLLAKAFTGVYGWLNSKEGSTEAGEITDKATDTQSPSVAQESKDENPDRD